MKNYKHPRLKHIPDIAFTVLAVLVVISLVWHLFQWLYKFIS